MGASIDAFFRGCQSQSVTKEGKRLNREGGENLMDVEVARDGDWVGNTGVIGGDNSDYSMSIGQNCMNI